MDLFVATSRGRELAEYFEKRSRAVFWFKGGRKLSLLGDKAVKLYGENTHLYTDVQDIHPNFVYILGGLPDLTQKIVDYYPHYYEEVVYTEDLSATYQRVTSTYTSLSQKIFDLNAIPCFSTIAPLDISAWNHHRLNTRATAHLLHHNHYADMTHFLNKAILHINDFITDLNEFNNVETPKFAGHVIKKRGQGKGHRFMFNHFEDGCHPSQYIIDQWINELEQVMSANRYRNATQATLDHAGANF